MLLRQSVPRPALRSSHCTHAAHPRCHPHTCSPPRPPPQVYGRRRPKFYVAAGFLEALQRQSVPHDGVEGSGVYVREVARTGHRGASVPAQSQ